MPRRRRRSRSINPLGPLAVLLIASIFAGLWYSPLTSLSRIRIVGVPAYDQARIRRQVEGLRGIPCLQIDSRLFESAVMSSDEVDSAELSRNIFGSALLRVRYRRPVARLDGRPGLALGEDGALFRTSRSLAHLPALQAPLPDHPIVATARPWASGRVAEFASRLADESLLEQMKISIDERGTLCLNMEPGRRIVFGSVDRLEAKLQAWKNLRRQAPDEYAKFAELNLSAPDRPSFKLKP